MSCYSELINLIQKKKGLIFDFDGVLVDSVNIKTNAFSELFSKYEDTIRLSVVNHHLENGGMSRFEKIKYYYSFFLKKKLNKNELKSICDNFSNLVVEKVISAPEISGSKKFIHEQFKKKKMLFINTGTPLDEINIILKKRSLHKYFDHVYGSPNSKEKNLNKIISGNSINKDDYIFFW